MWQHDNMLAQELLRFAQVEGITPAFARRLAACSCHPESETMRAANRSAGECNVTELGVGSSVHTDMRDGTAYQLMCNQGPWQHQLAVLATLKSSPLLMLHQNDSLSATPCSRRGFPAYLGVRACLGRSRRRPRLCFCVGDNVHVARARPCACDSRAPLLPCFSWWR